MPTTRDFKSLGEFAKDAIEVEPNDEIPRVNDKSYRNTVFTTFQQNQGKEFGVVPVSENANEQIYNQSQFTNLADFQGIPGWKEDVTYSKSAIIFGSNGTFYLSKRDNNINVDPVDDDYADDWWGIFEGGTEIAAKFADQTPGQEGSRLVGTTEIIPTTNTHLISGDFPKRHLGTTLKDNLDSNTRLFNQMENMEILASLGQEIISVNDPTPIIQDTSNFNVSSVDITNYSKTADAIGGGSFNRIGYLTVNFANSIPTPYLYQVTIQNLFPGGGIPSNEPAGLAFGAKREYYASTSTSVANVTANSIDIGSLSLSRLPETFNSFWPANWENESPDTRIAWLINLFCFRIL